ncbi:hypothetical protein MtrunA17_Chr3g0133991 [Medicago truncatula]|uniref:Uncharacterized protein n=1 Tax=Medicago truncatula TaxID=3880 RepID=A0A396J1M8_MEDTR|nr:hypothetical protein MtrunA17_Chr3g0133991 [Medicago truncatula]
MIAGDEASLGTGRALIGDQPSNLHKGVCKAHGTLLQDKRGHSSFVRDSSCSLRAN